MTTIITKNSSTAGAVPTSSDLVQGELAVNVTDTGLYTENASGTVVKLNAPSIDDKNTGATKYVTIASGGNVGVGTSSPTVKLDVVGNTRTAQADTSDAYFRTQNSFGSTYYIQKSDRSTIYTPTTQPFTFDIAGSERMRIDSSGNVGIGTSSPSVRLHVANSGDNVSYFERVGGSRTILYNASGDSYFGTTTNTPLRFATNDVERARFESSGTFSAYGSYANSYTATFSNTSTTSGSVSVASAAGTNSNATYIFYGTSVSANRFSAYGNGGLANYSANNINLSDRREKTNFAPAKNYLDAICSIPVQTFNYIDQDLENDGGLTLGVVAQDVELVAPELVKETNWGTEDEPKMRLSIYQTDLQYALMKCIQELAAASVEQQALITQLQADVAALKGQA